MPCAPSVMHSMKPDCILKVAGCEQSKLCDFVEFSSAPTQHEKIKV